MQWTLNGFCHPQKVRGLRWNDAVSPVSSCGSCPGSAPYPRPLTPALSVLIRFPHCCLHSSPSCPSPSQTPLHIQEAAPDPQTKNRLPFPLPPSAFPAPPRLSIQLCWLCVGPFSPRLSVHTGPSVPESGSSAQDTRRWVLPFLPALPGGALPSVFPQPSVGALDHLWVSPSIEAVNAGRHLSPVCFVPGPLHLLCLLTGCVPRQPQGSCVSPEKWKSLSCPTLCDLMDYTVNGILQARILEWVAFPFSKGSSQPRDHIQVSCIAGWFFSSWATGEAQQYWSGLSILSPAYLPDPGIELGSPALQADSLPIELSRTSPYIGLYVGLYD